MTVEDDRNFWPHAPHLLDDPYGWAGAWWRRIKNITVGLEIAAFGILAVFVVWRLAARGEVTEATFEAGGMLILAIVLGVQTVLARRRARATSVSGRRPRQ